jgi:hypothetical protein
MAAVIELTHRASLVGLEPAEEDETSASEIRATFRQKLTGLRRLPRHERAHALRAAREWLLLALMTLREKRARDRHAKSMFWQLQRPAPR